MSERSCYPDKAPVVDALLDTLSHPIRREVIYYFERTNGVGDASVTDIVRRLDDRMPPETDEQLRLGLVHTHLPKLESRGWLEYNPDTDSVTYLGHDSAKQLLSEVHAIF